MSFATDIERAAGAEQVIAVVVGRLRYWGDDEDDRKLLTPLPYDVVLDWATARPALDYEFDNGYGGADCEPVWAWTEKRVLFVGEYDGATAIESVPRNPEAGKPEHI